MTLRTIAKDRPATELEAHTVNSFCLAHAIGRTMLYELWNSGRGPDFFVVGAHRRISREAAARWRQQLEAEQRAASGPAAA